MNKVMVMGIVNVTPDSFSDGGRFYRPEEAVRRAKNLIEDGADIIDVGGESTRPGAVPVAWDEEWRRIEPVLEEIVGLADARRGSRRADAVTVSVDTYHPETAERALALGVGMINCVKREPVPVLMRLCAEKGAEIVIPHRIGWEPPPSVGGLSPILDPMIGFDTTREEDIGLLGDIPGLARLGRVMIGASRKRIVKRLTGEKTPGKDIAGNLAIVMYAAMKGASAVRVHDVKESVQALRVLDRLTQPL